MIDNRAYAFLPERGPSSAALLLLHGTGGDERSLLYLADQVLPAAAVLSVRGNVDEHGMSRHFRRFSEGVLDEDDVTARTDELAAFLEHARTMHGLAEQPFIAVGFSNGAVAAAALLLHRPDLLAGIVAVAGMAPYRGLPSGLPTAQRRALLVAGAADEHVSPVMSDGLGSQLIAAGADVTYVHHSDGHEVPADVLPRIAAQVALWLSADP